MDVHAVVLAAGAGSRLGLGPKALLPFAGRPLLEHVVAAVRGGGCERVVVVLGARAEEVRAATDLGDAEVVVNGSWAQGLSTSFRAGVAAATRGRDHGAVLVALVDQPGITGELVARVVGAHRPGTVTAARYGPGARPGHPMVLDAAVARAAAATAAGDAGAREYLRARPGLLRAVDVADLGDGGDVDVPADLGRLGPASA